MSRLICVPAVPPESVTRKQIGQVARAGRQDPVVKGCPSLTEGEPVSTLDAPNKERLSSWLGKMKPPCDSISQMELPGERGRIQECGRQANVESTCRTHLQREKLNADFTTRLLSL
jgi:hypothetical protein